MWSPREPDEAEVFDFLDTWTRDRQSGRELPLAHYLKRFPGHEEAIAREFIARTATTTKAASGAPVAQPEPASGERLIGPYRLLRELGRGGQGAVWLAEDTRIARKVALKFLPASFALLSADRRRRLQREAEVVSRLEHASICPVYEARIDGETPYIAMRYVEGETLADAITHAKNGAPKSPGALPLAPRNALEVRRVIAYFERVARALHAAHEAGVIHRDFKPGNTMVMRDGEPIVLDFGQARDEHAEIGDQTLSGEVLGTPAYMSPEQVAGHASGIDRRTDVWALGASLYEALTLERPFHGENVAQLLLSIQSDTPRNARAINPALDSDLAVVLATALEKDSHRRYASALDFAEDLRRVREYEPIHARPAGPMLRLRRWARRHPALATSFAVIFVSLTSGLAWSLYLLDREQIALDATERALARESVALVNTTSALERERVALSDAKLALSHALSRHLAERATDLLDEDSSASLVLAIQAVERAPNYQSRAALLSALDVCRLAAEFDGEPAWLFLDLDIGANSRVVAAGLDDGTARVFAIDDGAELVRTPAQACEVTHVRLDPSCTRMATTSTDKLVRIWNAQSGELEHVIDAPGIDAQWLEFDAAGEQLLALDRNGSCEVWRTSDWKRVAELRADPDQFGCARFSPDGRCVLMSSIWSARPAAPKSSLALLWSVAEARVIGQIAGHVDVITWAEFGSSGATVATASEDGTARLWHVPSCAPAAPPFDHAAPLTCARLSPDERQLVTGINAGAASAAWLWDIDTGAHRELRGAHRDKILSAEFSRDAERVVTVSSEMVMHVWSARDGRELMRSSAWIPPLRASWTPDGRRIVMLGNASRVPIWFGESPPDVYPLVGHDAPLYSARFSPDGKLGVTAGADGKARVWSTPSWRDGQTGVPPGTATAVLARENAHITHAIFNPGGWNVLTLTREGHVDLWDAHSGQRQVSERIEGTPLSVEYSSQSRVAIVSSNGRVYLPQLLLCPDVAPTIVDDAAACARFTPDGKRLIVGRRDCSVHVYDVEDGRELSGFTWTPRTTEGAVDLAIHPDGEQIAVACRDTRVRFFRFSQPSSDRDLPVFDMQDIAYNCDGSRLVASGPRGRGAIRLQKTGSVKVVLPGEVLHADSLTCTAFSPDGSLFLTASLDGTVFVRRASDGHPVAHLVGHRGAVVDAAFSNDAGPQRVITASADGTARVWPVDPLEPAQARIPRKLNVLEIKREQRLALPLEYR